jgi:predicted ATPase/DNA-binding winged helix-turn-helix (wHTH) protein
VASPLKEQYAVSDAFQFGVVRIQVDERRLLVHGLHAPVGARAFDLLVALAERRDRVVSRDELLDVVWPGLVVEDGNLAVQVSSLRKVLGAEAIATVPGRGYRFTLCVPPQRDAAVSVPHAPPMPATLFGRDAELTALAQLLAAHRLVTVVGAGGIGKTSLVLQALRYRDPLSSARAVLVELAPISDASLLPGAVAQALRLPSGGHADPIVALVSAMQSLQVLLVLDNAEHLTEAVSHLVQALLQGAPGVRLLVTSQVALKADQERLLRLGPLSVPQVDASVAEALSHGAVALFVDQARASDQRFELTPDNLPTVVHLCHQLDGVALAIKLAAARVSFLGLRGLAARLGERLKLLRGGHRSAPTRQQTLMAALDWSHSLLSAQEQAVFRRLSVFVGGFTLDLACAVAAGRADADAPGSLDDSAVVDILSALVDRSLVAVDEGDPPRYRLLESAREYAWLRLIDSGELDEVKQRHTSELTALFERADSELWVTQDLVWLARYTPELDNARAAMDWALRHDDPLAVGLMASLARLLFQLPLGHETRRRSDAVLPLVNRVADLGVRARYWVRRSHAHWGVNQVLALDYARRAADLYRAQGGDPYGLHEALYAMAASLRLYPADMQSVIDEMAALARPGWPARIRADHKLAQVLCCYVQGHYEPMHDAARDGLAISREAGSRLRVNILQWYWCTSLRCLGRTDEALAVSRAAIAELGPWRGWSLGYMLGETIWACLVKGDINEARQAMAEFLALTQGTGWTAFGYNSYVYPQLALLDSRDSDAAQLLGFADASWRRIGTVFPDMVRERERIHAALSARMDAPALQGWITLGESLDEAAACTLVLVSAPMSSAASSSRAG